MKKQHNNYLTSLPVTEVAKLINIVKETIATECRPQQKKVFNAADLWNIQKQRRSFVQRRFSL